MKRDEDFALRAVAVLCVLSLVWFLNAAPVGADEGSTIKELSAAFARVARAAKPGVVFIKVQKAVETGALLAPEFRFNDPFDLFNDEFFERFFRYRLPERRQPKKYYQYGQGSGFIISEDGYILTNNHVVGDADKITVRLEDKREFKAKLIGTDPRSDVAVIKINADDLPALKLGDSDKIEVGDWVIAIGNPFGLVQTVTAGIVSAKGRSAVGIADYEDFIQTDAAINPGNSGGPLLNLDAEVIGINTAIFTRSGGYMGIGFAIPINMAKAIKEQLVKKGKVTRGYLGVVIQDVSEDLAKTFGLEKAEGALVSEVTEDSPASKAGIKRGDVIIEYDGKKVEDVGHLRNMVALTPVGKKVSLVVVRDGKRVTLTVKIGELTEEVASARGEPSGLLDKLGFAVQDLTPELARQFGYRVKQGVIISSVEPGSIAAAAGLREGMLIEEVNRRKVRDTDDFMSALSRSAGKKSLLLLVRDGKYSRFVVLKWD